jgi:hypothetical protein
MATGMRRSDPDIWIHKEVASMFYLRKILFFYGPLALSCGEGFGPRSTATGRHTDGNQLHAKALCQLTLDPLRNL